MKEQEARDALSSAWTMLNMAENYVNESVACKIYNATDDARLQALAESILDLANEVQEIGEATFDDDWD